LSRGSGDCATATCAAEAAANTAAAYMAASPEGRG
jgi:hypothetical protein